jgi:hypothetical protein
MKSALVPSSAILPVSSRQDRPGLAVLSFAWAGNFAARSGDCQDRQDPE